MTSIIKLNEEIININYKREFTGSKLATIELLLKVFTKKLDKFGVKLSQLSLEAQSAFRETREEVYSAE